MNVHLRHELPTENSAVRDVHDRAFGRPQEGRLVDALRSSAAMRVSVVAEVAGRVVGHFFFSPVICERSVLRLNGMGLAPLAVLAEFQRQGIGAQLVRQGLDECRWLGQHFFAVVLGHPEYYPRFGFVPAATRNLLCEYSVPPEAFMVLELHSGAMEGCKGLVKYGPEFADL